MFRAEFLVFAGGPDLSAPLETQLIGKVYVILLIYRYSVTVILSAAWRVCRGFLQLDASECTSAALIARSTLIATFFVMASCD